MDLRQHFISSGKNMSELDNPVPAPYIRKYFSIRGKVEHASIAVCGIGFYRIFLNGNEFTKGMLAPYISNPEHFLYYDDYDVTQFLYEENMLGLLLGNGILNNPGGFVWDFHKARWRNPPMVSVKISILYENGESQVIYSDNTFETADSPIIFDDFRLGEHYDARLEQDDWCYVNKYAVETGKSLWNPAVSVIAPGGILRRCTAEPVKVVEKRFPVEIIPCRDGYLYDFGKNDAGLCMLHIEGKEGQEIVLDYGEWFHDGMLDKENLNFRKQGFVYGKDGETIQRDIYICRGGEASYLPSFTYHGFRYVLVKGLTKEQAVEGLLTCYIMHSDLKETGGFLSSDKVSNAIFDCVRRSDYSNFYYFPTDCPHREKNGWLGDAALSVEHMLLTFSAENSLKEWLCNIRAAQMENGSFPGIVPTSGWGEGIYGPSHENAVIVIPYYIFKYTGNLDIIRMNGNSIFRYLQYLHTKKNDKNLFELGLGDWCQTNMQGYGESESPDEVVISIFVYQLLEKAKIMFREIGWTEQEAYAADFGKQLKKDIRNSFIDFTTMAVKGETQTCQSMAIHYDIFEEKEKEAAFSRLISYIHKADDHMRVGVWGARVLFHVLSDFGKTSLAFNMITRVDYPSYGNLIARGATTIWEEMNPEGVPCTSMNHHFWGDVNSWFIQKLAGIHVNPDMSDSRKVYIIPHFIEELSFVQAWYESRNGKISVRWESSGALKKLSVSILGTYYGEVRLPCGWKLKDGNLRKNVREGDIILLCIKV